MSITVSPIAAPSLNPQQKIAAGFAKLCQDHPYFRTAAMSLIRVEVDHGTMAVSARGVLYWNPTFVQTLTVEQISWVLSHELYHLLFNHADRAAGLGIVPPANRAEAPRLVRLARIWNLGADCAINDTIRDMPGALPFACYPETFKKLGLDLPRGLTAEDYYQRILKHQEEKESQGGGSSGDEMDEGEGGSGGSDDSLPAPGVASGECGGAAGNPSPDEANEADGKLSRSEAELQRVRNQTAEAVREAATKNRGTVPGALARWAEETLAPPKIDWRTKLASVLRSAIAYRPGAMDLTWSRPSRRQAGLGFGAGRAIVPAMHAPIPRAACVIDTSGSMGTAELTAACSEVDGVLRALGTEINVCMCDAEVHGIVRVRTIEDAIAALHGGGGTDMTPAFEALVAQPASQRPEVIVVLTDGYIGNGYPTHEPEDIRVVWVVVGDYSERPCPWGEWIHVDDVGAHEESEK